MSLARLPAMLRPRHVLLLLCLAVFIPASQALDLYLTAGWSYTYSGNTVVLTVAKISNYRSGGTSGSLRLELWAFASPYDGTAMPGYQLATYQLNPLSGGYAHNNVSSGSRSATRPPVGNWYMALLLTEYTGSTWDTNSYLLAQAGQYFSCSSAGCDTVTSVGSGPSVSLTVNQSGFQANSNETVTLSADLDAGSAAGTPADVYVTASLDLGQTYYLNSALQWVSTSTPVVSNFALASVSAPGFYSVPTTGLPSGNLRFAMTVVRAGTSPTVPANQLAFSAANSNIQIFSSGSTITLAATALPTAKAGAVYQGFDFYPWAKGGYPPYHFVLDTLGGFPPIGIILQPNGKLVGTASSASSGTYTFVVCAVDLLANQSCKVEKLRVVETTTTTPPPTNNNYYLANWSCGSSSACAAIMGGATGSRGYFCSISDCQAWAQKYITTASCSTTATYKTDIATSVANGKCAVAGVDF